MTILLKGGRVINPAENRDETADVLIENGKVKKIDRDISESEADRVISAKDCYVMPGFIDMHVHFRDPGYEQKEDIFSGMQAAAHGGYTTVLTMPIIRTSFTMFTIRQKPDSAFMCCRLEPSRRDKKERNWQI